VIAGWHSHLFGERDRVRDPDLIAGSAVYMPLHIYQQRDRRQQLGRSRRRISVIFMLAVLIGVYLLNLLTRMTPADAKA